MMDSASQFGEGDGMCPPSKRAKTSKVGIGYCGVCFDLAKELLPEKVFLKKCKFCFKAASARDDIHSEQTLAWGAPDWGGKTCGLCRNTKNRLHPTMTMNQAVGHVTASPDARTQFDDFRAWLVSQYKAGAKCIKDQLAGFDSRPIEQVSKDIEYSTIASDDGIMQLYKDYVAEKKCEPEANGHVRMNAEWKDGSIQDVVLIPDLASDKMRVSFSRKSSLKHSTTLDDGTVTKDPAQQAELFNGLKGNSVSQLKGKVMPSQLPTPLPEQPAPSDPSKVSAGEGQSWVSRGCAQAGPEPMASILFFIFPGGRARILPRNLFCLRTSSKGEPREVCGRERGAAVVRQRR